MCAFPIHDDNQPAQKAELSKASRPSYENWLISKALMLAACEYNYEIIVQSRRSIEKSKTLLCKLRDLGY